jgi:hypothetical protein
MFANRFTAFIDACSLVPALNRNLLLSLAEAEFFRIRWSVRVLDETEQALTGILSERGIPDAAEKAARARGAMERAFADAVISGYESLMPGLHPLPDPNDAHVIAAAVKTRASIIVTENLKDFPERVLAPLDLEAKTTDSFLADNIGLDPGRAVAAVRTMRERLERFHAGCPYPQCRR